MPKYDITFARTGSMTVEANSKEEAMRIANQTATVDTVNWCDDLSATDAEELPDEDPTDSENKPVAVLPLQDYNLNIRPIGNGYAISIDEAQNVQKVKPLVDGYGWEYEVLLDPNSDFRRAMGVPLVPHVFVIDGNGKVALNRSGYTEGGEEHLIEVVRELIDGTKQ